MSKSFKIFILGMLFVGLGIIVIDLATVSNLQKPQPTESRSQEEQFTSHEKTN